MKKKGPLTPEAFKELLLWLDPDLEEAARKYELIRFKLIKIFARWGCRIPEELADETIDRVGLKLPQIAESYSGDKRLYFYGVAKNVYLEYLDDPDNRLIIRVDDRFIPEPAPEPEECEQQERRHKCLDECLEKLSEQDREFILQYYRGDKGDRIDNRKKMAESRGVSVETLRMRAHRIKCDLKKCVRECVARRQ